LLGKGGQWQQRGGVPHPDGVHVSRSRGSHAPTALIYMGEVAGLGIARTTVGGCRGWLLSEIAVPTGGSGGLR
jgi:hypothetical protein